MQSLYKTEVQQSLSILNGYRGFAMFKSNRPDLFNSNGQITQYYATILFRTLNDLLFNQTFDIYTNYANNIIGNMLAYLSNIANNKYNQGLTQQGFENSLNSLLNVINISNNIALQRTALQRANFNPFQAFANQFSKQVEISPANKDFDKTHKTQQKAEIPKQNTNTNDIKQPLLKNSNKKYGIFKRLFNALLSVVKRFIKLLQEGSELGSDPHKATAKPFHNANKNKSMEEMRQPMTQNKLKLYKIKNSRDNRDEVLGEKPQFGLGQGVNNFKKLNEGNSKEFNQSRLNQLEMIERENKKQGTELSPELQKFKNRVNKLNTQNNHQSR